MPTVAVIGAGPSGLVTARYLKNEGFDVAIYEQSRSLGGQSSLNPRSSGVWPSMRTNTTRVLTAFSDLPHPAGQPGLSHQPGDARLPAALRRGVRSDASPAGGDARRADWRRRERWRLGRPLQQPRSPGDQRGLRPRRRRRRPLPEAGNPRRARARHLCRQGGRHPHQRLQGSANATAGGACSWRDAPSARSRSPATWPCSAPSVW